LRVPYIDLGAQYRDLKPAIDAAVEKVLTGGRYIGGEQVALFEEKMAAYLGVKHVVSCGNGYDALFLALTALNPQGKEVGTDSYTHVSTHAAIEHCGAIPVLDAHPVECDYWLPVHMNGRCKARVSEFRPAVEDACQALGASYKGKKAGTFGLLGCFSLHPMKVLGCAGDGGFIATDSPLYADDLRCLRNHGSGNGFGVNSRLDNLQAAILNVKMTRLHWYIERRREIAQQYHDGLETELKPPPPSNGDHFDVYSSYVIGGSPELLKELNEKGVECFSHIKTDVVSLPIYPEMTDEQVKFVIDAVNSSNWR
jgi:dTDP-4-amino-4,6-dideoxygalactose transaminase